MALFVAALLYLEVGSSSQQVQLTDDFALLTSFALLMSNDVDLKLF